MSIHVIACGVLAVDLRAIVERLELPVELHLQAVPGPNRTIEGYAAGRPDRHPALAD